MIIKYYIKTRKLDNKIMMNSLYKVKNKIQIIKQKTKQKIQMKYNKDNKK